MPVAWLKPTRTKWLFLIEWSAFIVIEFVMGGLRTAHSLLVAAYPLLFFYLVACSLDTLSHSVHRIAPTGKLVALALGLALLDQALKSVIAVWLPEGTSVPVIDTWLHVAHARNYGGSWVTAAFGVDSTTVVKFVRWSVVIAVLVILVICHRTYARNHSRRFVSTDNRRDETNAIWKSRLRPNPCARQQRFWADVAFLCLAAAFMSWICDMAFRGYVLDFIELPGLVAADLKDIFATIGAAAFLAAYFEHQTGKKVQGSELRIMNHES